MSKFIIVLHCGLHRTPMYWNRDRYDAGAWSISETDATKFDAVEEVEKVAKSMGDYVEIHSYEPVEGE